MSNSYIDEPMLEAYVYETTQMVETLETLLLESETEGEFTEDALNEIFRLMHTVKGSSAMMMFNEMSSLAHHLEDIYFVIREEADIQYDFMELVDLSLESVDYFKIEVIKIKNKENADGDNEALIKSLVTYLEKMKADNKAGKHTKEKVGKKAPLNNEEKSQKYYISPNRTPDEECNYFSAKVFFQDNCEMENIRAYTIIHNLMSLVDEVFYTPDDIIDNDKTAIVIKEKGFAMVMKTPETEETITTYLNKTIFLAKLEFQEIGKDAFDLFRPDIEVEPPKEDIKVPKTSKLYKEQEKVKKEKSISVNQSIISVNVDKLDSLMDMVGELVIAEAMVSQNPDIVELEIESFEKASRQLHKITGEMQDMVMAIRMVPLSTTFMKMHRIVRDMCKKLSKDVGLDVVGEETEVDKNIIEKISDPLMHIIRNSLDHGIEDSETRVRAGKSEKGTVTLEAKNSGSDVLVIVRDDGKGLNKEKIYQKALEHGLVNQPIEDMSDREVYNLVLAPGFSTKEEVTEFSGRGVGMDVVAKNIESVGGTVLVDSKEGEGTSIILKIPLTLAIIEGMNIKVGDSRFTIPIVSIQESFRPKNNEVFEDTDGNEMIMLRGTCYPVLRLHEFYNVETNIKTFDQGIMIMVEEDGRGCCIFADELIGQQQVVVKSLPEYVKRYKKIEGLGGCTLLGDGSISLILDVGELNLSDTRAVVNA